MELSGVEECLILLLDTIFMKVRDTLICQIRHCNSANTYLLEREFNWKIWAWAVLTKLL